MMLPESNLEGREAGRLRERDTGRKKQMRGWRRNKGMRAMGERENERSPTQESMVLVLCSC